MTKNIKQLVIVGAGGLGREVAWLVNDINKQNMTWEIVGFVDDSKVGYTVEGYPIVGMVEDIFKIHPLPTVVIAIADAEVRSKIYRELSQKGIEFATLIHPSVFMSEYVNIGQGSIICAGTIITTNVKLGKACIVNPNCFIGHDTFLDDFVSLMPGANIAGEVTVGKGTYFGLKSAVINRVNIGSWSVIGAGATVISNIPDYVTAVGVPARIIKQLETKGLVE